MYRVSACIFIIFIVCKISGQTLSLSIEQKLYIEEIETVLKTYSDRINRILIILNKIDTVNKKRIVGIKKQLHTATMPIQSAYKLLKAKQNYPVNGIAVDIQEGLITEAWKKIDLLVLKPLQTEIKSIQGALDGLYVETTRSKNNLKRCEHVLCLQKLFESVLEKQNVNIEFIETLNKKALYVLKSVENSSKYNDIINKEVELVNKLAMNIRIKILIENGIRE